jgi:hypothetical protein
MRYRVQQQHDGNRWVTAARTTDRTKAVDLADVWAEDEPGTTFRVLGTGNTLEHTTETPAAAPSGLPQRVLCARTPYARGQVFVPALRYYNAARSGSWGRYDEATRYRAEQRPSLPLGPIAGVSVVESVPVADTDLDGYPTVDDDVIGPVRLTHCCLAATSTVDGPLYCKSCYEEVDWAYDGPARTAERPVRPATGPIRITLPPQAL